METRYFIRFLKSGFTGLFALLLVSTACNVTKYIPENELLYTGAELKIIQETPEKGVGGIKEELQGLLRPKPNNKILGQYLGLWSYFKMQKEHPGFINRYIYKKIGEEPVYLSQVDPEKTEELILNRLDNNGFFYAEAISSFRRKEKRAMSGTKSNCQPLMFLVLIGMTAIAFQLTNISGSYWNPVKYNLAIGLHWIS